MADGEPLDWENFFDPSLFEDDLPWQDGLELESMNFVQTTTFAGTDASILPCTIPPTVTDTQQQTDPRQAGDQAGPAIETSAVVTTITSDCSLESSVYNHDTPVSTLRFLAPEASPSNSLAGPLSKSKKKRDPRLQCPNFLAGRIPCSCPEEDELDADLEVEAMAKKRSKVGARCQVPSCGEDISHLKGYHQRHRVCLACANSPRVMLKDVPHRYCQQCGKFHRLSDFDEGKRSCRRKLERHNKLRRRRLVEDEGDAQNNEAQLLGIDNDCNISLLNLEGVATQNAKTGVTSGEQCEFKTTGHDSGKATDSQLRTNSWQAGDQDSPAIETSAVVTTITSDGSRESNLYKNDTKKQDPRLQCPNFLAGRIPCACPEEDELQANLEIEVLSKKRSKVEARCQVPSCGEDISHLKGYHQRHRVCLACANSPKVMLPHRYCQQCGKFHRLSDFDEDKRSCRRKLERHNILRRRRLVEEEGDAQNNEAQLLGFDSDCSISLSNLEGASTQNAKTGYMSRGPCESSDSRP